MTPSERLPAVAIAGTMGANQIGSAARRTRFHEGPAKKTTYLRLCLAFVLSFFWFWVGGLRTEQIGHDFLLYADQVTRYYSPSDIRFPDLVFHSIATIVTMVLDLFGVNKALAARVFFLTIALLQAALLFAILRSKRSAEMILIAIGFGPLIFLDIIRQGLAMLFAGAYFVARDRKKAGLLLLAFSTHVSSIVSIGAFDLRKTPLATIMGAVGIVLILGWFLIDDLTARYVWYSYHEGYLAFAGVPDVAAMQFSYFNAIVLMFFSWSIITGFLSRQEGGVLILLYLLSAALPLFFRTYVLYFFVMACSRDVLVRKWSMGSVLFNTGYVFLILRMAPLAFVATDPGAAFVPS